MKTHTGAGIRIIGGERYSGNTGFLAANSPEVRIRDGFE
jgi:hypothetical protein